MMGNSIYTGLRAGYLAGGSHESGERLFPVFIAEERKCEDGRLK